MGKGFIARGLSLSMLGLLVLVPGCRRKDKTPAPAGGGAPQWASLPSAAPVVPGQTQPSPPPPRAAWTFERVLGPGGVGPLRLGMPAREVKDQLKAFQLVPNAAPGGFLALDLNTPSGRELQLIFDQLELAVPLRDSAPLRAILTENPAFSTSQGLRAGMPTAEARGLLGEFMSVRRDEFSGAMIGNFTRCPAWLEVHVLGFEGLAESGQDPTQMTQLPPGATLRALVLKK